MTKAIVYIPAIGEYEITLTRYGRETLAATSRANSKRTTGCSLSTSGIAVSDGGATDRISARTLVKALPGLLGATRRQSEHPANDPSVLTGVRMSRSERAHTI